jgi:hypothetical protein
MAYIADGAGGLVAIDVSVPSSPARAGSCDTQGYAGGVDVDGDVAYVAAGTYGLVLVDISDPTAPVEAGRYDTSGEALGVAVEGDAAYVADGSAGLVIVDISDPAHLVEAGTYDTAGEAAHVSVTGDYAYVSADTEGLVVLDVMDPSTPIRVGTYDTGGTACAAAAIGRRAYVADGPDGLVVIAIADRAGPVQVGSSYFTSYARGITIAGDYVYVASRDNGLVVVDVSDPSDPVQISSYGTGGAPKAVAVSGVYAYVADGPPGLAIIDVSDPSAPLGVAVCPTADPTYDVALAGARAYVADSYSGMVVIDIANPAAPSVVGSHDTEGIAVGIAVGGDYAFVADRDSGLIIFDISIPSAPVPVGSCNTEGLSRGVTVDGDYAYVADGPGGLVVIDISNPAAPNAVGSCDVGVGAYDVVTEEDLAFVADSYGGLVVVDISNPAGPVLVGSCAEDGTARDVVVAGDLAYVALDNAGLRIFSVLDRFVDPGGDVGQSLALPVTSPTDTVREARLSSVQTDSVTWEISGDSTYWQPLIPGIWVELEQPGTDLYWRSAHHYVEYRINPAVSLMKLEWPDAEPGIEAVRDVPDDQGGWVDVSFHRSAYDFTSESDPVVNYYVWRRTDGGAGQASDRPGRRCLADLSGTGQFPPGEWAVAGSTLALQQSQYVVAARTEADSGETGASCAVFIVSAHTADSAVYWFSSPDSGWSVDNLPPTVPTDLVLTDSLFSWDDCPDGDFHHFSVYGSQSGELGSAEWIGDTVIPAMDISGEDYAWYHVTASDSAGNESADASADAGLVSVEGLPEEPLCYRLNPGRPNPFTNSTLITFSLALGGRTRVAVFDVSGCLVASLVDDELPPGRHSVIWDRTRCGGPGIAPGIYFVSLRAGAFRASNKLVCLR